MKQLDSYMYDRNARKAMKGEESPSLWAIVAVITTILLTAVIWE